MMMGLLALKQAAEKVFSELDNKDIASMDFMEKARYSNRIGKIRGSLVAYQNSEQGVNDILRGLDYLRGQLAGVGEQQQETVQQKNKRRAEILQNGVKETPYPIPQSFYASLGQIGQR
ncbi:hypothetical protein [Bacillus wiedmannii]|uniref:hypothetical protein n=1 Tax=Bacillus wiedmannii TaxID=1890302 RepID=UPI000BF3030A|nr:hypothetical protein [Bacillus wiedmannii]PGD91918.1 hypothetical protein COM48_22605 [Bacillus wiedmannii]